MKQIILIFLLAAVSVTSLAQPDKRDVRRGNRDFRKENYKEAEIEYRKAIVKDSLSIAANYNLAADLYRQGNPQEAAKVLDRIKEAAQSSEYAADYFYNLGDVAIANQDWKTAVDAFRESLLRNPGDLDAKENYIYARKKLQEQQDQQQNQDQNQQNDQNQDNKDDQNKDDQQKDDQQDQNKDNKQDQQKDQQQEEDQPKISPQAAQQMLQAIQAKEKETQEKVKKEKAQALQSRQKERNW
ncbi:MAG: tetratricopeptide repeat protein [Bacteroidales bacterium]|nr:tetratricopeptide repeat protein [Bacteroidales bacterium]